MTAVDASGTERVFVTGRGAVNMADCDQLGHMNMQFYLARASDAQADLAARPGLGPRRLAREQLAVRPLTDRTLFKRALRGGDIHAIRSGIRAVHDDGTIDIASRMTNLGSGVEAAAFETRLCLVDADDGAQPWPADSLAAARVPAGELPEMPAPPAVAAVLPPGPPPLSGCCSPAAAPSNPGIAMPTVWRRRARTSPASTTPSRTCSARCSWIARRCWPPAPDRPRSTTTSPTTARCAPARRSRCAAACSQPARSSITSSTTVVDANDGAVYTMIVVAALFSDLKQRKSVPMPPAVRAAIERLIVHD